MARFPKKRDDIIELANRQVQAIEDDPDHFPANEYALREIRSSLRNVSSALKAWEKAKAAAAEAQTELTGQVQELGAVLQENWKRARIDYRDQTDLRRAIGDAPVPARRGVPGRVPDLIVVRTAPGEVEGEFQEPARGPENGLPKAYRVQWRTPDKLGSLTDWSNAEEHVVFERHFTIAGLPQKVDIEFRVAATNRYDDGEPSYSVRTVL
ncbi:MAG: fibronectin type III domain-containing protein [Candidatus Sumerlaeota bacterium]